jgi:hypothetical protein
VALPLLYSINDRPDMLGCGSWSETVFGTLLKISVRLVLPHLPVFATKIKASVFRHSWRPTVLAIAAVTGFTLHALTILLRVMSSFDLFIVVTIMV